MSARSRRRQSSSMWTMVAFGVASVAVHALLAGGGALDGLFAGTPGHLGGLAMIDPEAGTTSINVLSAAEADALAAEADEETQKNLDEARKSEDDPDMAGQVVDIPRPAVEVRPDKADYLSEYDSVATKQTVKRSAGGSPGPAGAADGRDPQAAPRKGGGVGGEMQPVPGTGPRASNPGGEQGGMRPDGFEGDETPGGTLPKKGPMASGEPSGAGGDGRPLPKIGDLRPTDDALSKAAGGGGVNDYLKDVEEGDETVLTSKRWRFSSFFNRMKNQVAQQWHPDVAYRLRDPSGKIYGTKNRLTVLRVSLDPKGGLKDIFLEKPSGVDFLDDEAESAFRAAEPFPNPPAQLVNGDTGVISFRFGFLFEITSAPRFRVFRYND